MLHVEMRIHGRVKLDRNYDSAADFVESYFHNETFATIDDYINDCECFKEEAITDEDEDLVLYYQGLLERLYAEKASGTTYVVYDNADSAWIAFLSGETLEEAVLEMAGNQVVYYILDVTSIYFEEVEEN